MQNHPFVDGNKRTGFAATYVFLVINGLTVVADPVGTFGFIDRSYKASTFRFEQLDPWLRTHVR